MVLEAEALQQVVDLRLVGHDIGACAGVDGRTGEPFIAATAGTLGRSCFDQQLDQLRFYSLCERNHAANYLTRQIVKILGHHDFVQFGTRLIDARRRPGKVCAGFIRKALELFRTGLTP